MSKAWLLRRLGIDYSEAHAHLIYLYILVNIHEELPLMAIEIAFDVCGLDSVPVRGLDLKDGHKITKFGDQDIHSPGTLPNMRQLPKTYMRLWANQAVLAVLLEIILNPLLKLFASSQLLWLTH